MVSLCASRILAHARSQLKGVCLMKYSPCSPVHHQGTLLLDRSDETLTAACQHVFLMRFPSTVPSIFKSVKKRGMVNNNHFITISITGMYKEMIMIDTKKKDYFTRKQKTRTYYDMD